MIEWSNLQKVSTDTLSKERLFRLKNAESILGEPDLISISKTIITSSFLSQKKQIQRSQFFVFGLNFQSTAHFSTFVNQFIKKEKKEKGQIFYKIKLHMFDIYREVDVQIQISIPGSLEIKGYNLSGQPTAISPKDYERAYFSSTLRSLFPKNYHHSVKRFNQIQNFQNMEGFINYFVPFCENQVLELSQVEEEKEDFKNLGIQILSYYLLNNRLWKLSQIFMKVLQKYFPMRNLIFKLQFWLRRREFKKVIIQTASKLMDQNFSTQITTKLKEYQIRALFRQDKRYQVKQLGQALIHEGLSDIQTWKVILNSYSQDNKDKVFIKLINTAFNFLNDNQSLNSPIEKMLKLQKNKIFVPLQEKQIKSKKISDYSMFCMKFDLGYLNNHPKVHNFIEILEKSKKQKSTFELITKIDNCLKHRMPLSDVLILFQKQRGWNKLIKIRNECFWLQSDFVAYGNSLKENKKLNDESSFRFLNESIAELDSKKSQTKEERILRENDQDEEDEIEGVNQSFDGDFSDSEDNEKQVSQIAPCSKRMAITKRFQHQKSFKKTSEGKILCHYMLQKNFMSLYQGIRLQIDLQKWGSKINIKTIQQLSLQKKELLAIIFIKKAYLHKQMKRYRKCEEAFKLARKFSPSILIGIICCYSLAILYKENNNLKGVEFYMVEIVRIFWSIGIEEYDIIPEWGKETIPYIIENHGKQIVKKLEGPLKQIVQLWLNLAEAK